MQAASPGMLDLIPWGPSSPHHHEDAFDLDPHIWSHLPENLLHSVLEWLPFHSVLRFRCVCKQFKALFASPSFHHFASHRAHVPPLIFFIGSCVCLDDDNRNNDVINHYDDGYDENGYVYEDDKGYTDYVPDGSIYDDSYGDSPDVMRYVEHVNMPDDMRGGDHEDMHDIMKYVDEEDMHDVMRYGDHRDMYDLMRYDDPGDMHDVIGNGDHGAISDVDDKGGDGCTNDQEAPELDPNIESLLLIFDCESESWRRPLAIPPGFKLNPHRHSFLARYHVCTFQEQVLIPTVNPSRFFLFNPASPPWKELPPCIAIQHLECFGFVEERTTLPGSVTWSNLSNLCSMPNEEEPCLQDKTVKTLQVVAVGDTVNDTHIVERFDSVTGSWHVIGRLPPQSDEFWFEQLRMIYCAGCFYALLSSGILMISNVLVGGQKMEWKYREFPDPPNRDGGLSDPRSQLIDWRLVATSESVFLIGVIVTSFSNNFEQEDWDILIWEFHPPAPADACWELHACMPSRIWDIFIGGVHVSSIDYLAHGDLIFLKVLGRQRFLIYDLPQKLWRFSAKCKYFLDRMTFVWEPLLRN